MSVQYSIQKMVSNGTLSTIALGIKYLQRDDIYVRIAGVETPQTGAPSGYTWSFLDNTTLRIIPVVPDGVDVVIYRRTDINAMYNIYSQNAQFDEATIDENNQQLLYIAQEYLEQGIPGAGVESVEFLREVNSLLYYRLQLTDGSYTPEFTIPRDVGSYDDIYSRLFVDVPSMLRYTGTGVGVVVGIPQFNARYVMSLSDDGTGLLTAGGLYANVVVEQGRIETNWLGIQEGQDITSRLEALKAKVVAESITEIVLNVNVKVTGLLDYAYNRVAFSGSALTGVGKLGINNANNAIQAIQHKHSPYKTYSGKFNGSYLDNQAVRVAITDRKILRVVLLGDSIGVTSDWDSKGVLPGARDIQGVDNLSTVNSLGFLMFQELCAAVGPNVRVQLYSRCVGGKSYAQLNAAWDSAALGANWSGREECTPGKAWINCVLDLKPDLVIHEMGMNHGAFDYYNNFYDKWHLALVSRGVLGTFDQAIMTTPSPNFENAGSFGDFRNFTVPMFYVAALQRYVATKFNMSLIDVSFSSFLKRYGIDPRMSVMSKTYEEVLLDGGTSKLLPAGGPSVYFDHSLKPFYHQTTFTVNRTSGSGLDFKVDFGGGVLVQFGDVSANIYTGFFSSGVNITTVAYTLPTNTDVVFTVQVLPQGVFLYQGDNGSTLLLSNTLTSHQGTIGGTFINTSTSVDITVSGVRMFAGEFPRYASDTATTEMYGVLDYTQNPFGGGINHPSNKGLAEIYIPPFREYCTRLTEVSEKQVVINYETMSNNDLLYIGSVEQIPNNICEFHDNVTKAYLRVVVAPGGFIQSVDNRTGFTLYYTTTGAFYALITGNHELKGLNYTGVWRKFGGTVVNSAFAPQITGQVGITIVPPNNSTVVFTDVQGVTTRYDTVDVLAGTAYTYTLSIPDVKFVSADCAISVYSITNPTVQVEDKVTIGYKANGIVYLCSFTSDASTQTRRLMFRSSYTK